MVLRPPDSKLIPLRGGVYQTKTPILMDPGHLAMSLNMEAIAGIDGYSRNEGIEGIDGHPLPSEAVVLRVEADPSAAITEGDKFNGTGYSIYILRDNTGADRSTYLYCPGGLSTIIEDETTTLDGGVTTLVMTDPSTSTYGESVDGRSALYVSAVETARSHISMPEGFGPLVGVFRLDGDVYCFREDVTENGKLNLWKSTPTGWEKFTPLGNSAYRIVKFTKGYDANTLGFVAGDSIAASGASNGAGTTLSLSEWGGGWDEAADVDKVTGYIIVNVSSGTFLDIATLTAGNGTTAEQTGNSSTVEMNSGGIIECFRYNYYTDIDREAIYGCDSVNYAWEFDGTNFIPIIPETGVMDGVYPTHIANKDERLWLSFPGGIFMCSAGFTVGLVNHVLIFSQYYSTEWNSGEKINKLHMGQNSVLIVVCAKSLWVLTGNGPDHEAIGVTPWSFRRYKSTIGGMENTIAGKDDMVFINGTILDSLSTTDAFGDFSNKSIAPQIQPYLDRRVQTCTTNLICKKKAQYRLFFESGDFLSISFDGLKVSACMPGRYPVKMLCTWSEIDDDGIEYMYGGGEDGNVWKIDSGGTFGADEIEGAFRIPYFHCGSARNWKNFLWFSFQMASPLLLTNQSHVSYNCSFSNGSFELPKGVSSGDVKLAGGGGRYDDDFHYGEFVYSAQPVTELSDHLDGVGTNISFLINFNTKYDKPFGFHALLLDYVVLGRAF